jgi:methionyl-tRNA formyltransferase
MKISLLCSSKKHPVVPYLEEWIGKLSCDHEIELVFDKSFLSGGDLLFLVSCSQIVTKCDRRKYRGCFVLHASDLPNGRGWSPHVWEIAQGADKITVSLIDAEDKIDTGKIWKKVCINVPRHALWNEINDLLFKAEIYLIDQLIDQIEHIEPIEQDEFAEATYFPRRDPRHSRIDPKMSIASQFDKIRVCDPIRYPAHFSYRGKKYKLIIEKTDD